MAEQLSATHRLVVVAGHPTDVELAAVTAALERHRAHSAAAGGHRPAITGTSPVAASRWARAARLEGCGHAPIADPAGISR